MREFRTSGSVGAPGERSPGATRQNGGERTWVPRFGVREGGRVGNLEQNLEHPLPYRFSTTPPRELRNTNKIDQCIPSNISKDASASARARSVVELKTQLTERGWRRCRWRVWCKTELRHQAQRRLRRLRYLGPSHRTAASRALLQIRGEDVRQ